MNQNEATFLKIKVYLNQQMVCIKNVEKHCVLKIFVF